MSALQLYVNRQNFPYVEQQQRVVLLVQAGEQLADTAAAQMWLALAASSHCPRHSEFLQGCYQQNLNAPVDELGDAAHQFPMFVVTVDDAESVV